MGKPYKGRPNRGNDGRKQAMRPFRKTAQIPPEIRDGNGVLLLRVHQETVLLNARKLSFIGPPLVGSRLHIDLIDSLGVARALPRLQ